MSEIWLAQFVDCHNRTFNYTSVCQAGEQMLVWTMEYEESQYLYSAAYFIGYSVSKVWVVTSFMSQSWLGDFIPWTLSRDFHLKLRQKELLTESNKKSASVKLLFSSEAIKKINLLLVVNRPQTIWIVFLCRTNHLINFKNNLLFY